MRNHRYDEERNHDGPEPIFPIIPAVAIVFCCLIVMEVIYFGGQAMLIKQTSFEFKELARGISNFITGGTRSESLESKLRPYPLYSTPQIVVPKTRSQIVYENSTKAYQAAVQENSEFKKIYQKPEQCNYLRDHATRVFCANDFMRAKKEWEKNNSKS